LINNFIPLYSSYPYSTQKNSYKTQLNLFTFSFYLSSFFPSFFFLAKQSVYLFFFIPLEIWNQTHTILSFILNKHLSFTFTTMTHLSSLLLSLTIITHMYCHSIVYILLQYVEQNNHSHMNIYTTHLCSNIFPFESSNWGTSLESKCGLLN
jgi:hypothetical protein